MAEKYLTGFAIWSANGFFKNAREWAGNERRKNAENPLSPLVGPAVNLNLAAELYLKAMIICYRRKVPQKHDLNLLFESLPKDLRGQLQTGYAELTDKNPREESRYTKEFLRVGPDLQRLREDAKHDKEPISDGISLLDVLKHHADSFASLRYVHELKLSPDMKHEYDFHAMIVAVEVLRQASVQLADQRGFLMTWDEKDTS